MLLNKNITDYNRFQAFTIHLLISLILFLILLVCITQYWYPGILFDTGNGWKAIGMIVGIDLVLGPLLTLIIFNPIKPSLKFDLSVIALIQLSALIYGSSVIYQTRPIALAFLNSSFITIYANSDYGVEVDARIRELGTNQLYYNYDKSEPSSSIQPEQFDSYSNNANKVLTIRSPYISTEPKNKNLLINIDPLISRKHLIEVDYETGKIIRFILKK